MELFFIFLIAIFVISAFGGGKNKKAKKRAALSQKNWVQSVYEREKLALSEEAAGGMQDDDFGMGTLYRMSKAKADKVRREASAKLQYNGLPEVEEGDDVQRFETTAKTNRRERASGAVSFSAGQGPLVRDMNMSRKLFLSGGRGNTLGERQSKSGGIKTLFAFVILGAIIFAIAHMLNSLN